MNVALIGASDDPEKYAHRAFTRLKAAGHRVFLVHPTLKEVEGEKVYASIADVPAEIDTVTLYVSPKVSAKIADEILAKKPKRILFNPGAENPEFEAKAAAQGVKTLEACTLVMLSTGNFARE